MADEPKTYTQQELDAEIAGLKTKNQELIGTNNQLKDKLKPWEGKDPEQVGKVLEEHAKATADAQKAKGDWDAREQTLRTEFKTEHERVVSPLQQENAQLKARLFDAVAVRDATEAIAAAEGNSKLLLPVIQSELMTVVVEGKEVTGIKGEDGKPRYHPTTGKLVTPADRVAELKASADYAGAFKGAPGSGTGTRPAGPGGKVIRSLSDFANDKEKVGFIAEHGQAAFETLAYAPKPPQKPAA
jgi:hypothetical protein